MRINSNPFTHAALVAYRHILGHPEHRHGLGYAYYQDVQGQAANDFIFNILSTGQPLMISKFGSVELSNLVSMHINHTTGLTKEIVRDFADFNVQIASWVWLEALCTNAGFYPHSRIMQERWYQLMLEDIKQVDILGSYVYEEKYVAPLMTSLKKRTDITGYFAPYLWNRPWSRYLKGKRVLVVHPFVDSIKSQYENKREVLFADPDVLPKFKELVLVKAVQTQADAVDPRYKDWFEALQSMKDEIDSHEYDIALIGCGAYGMCLAAHVKRRGKQAIHLASMTQMLFGIYGKRWVEDEPEYKRFINKNWIRPGDSETPAGAKKVEGGAYW